MSFPKYYVSYCVMGMEAGANPFNHSFLIFSKQESENGPIEVINSLGYYSQPSTTKNPIKELLGFKVDLQGGHGILLKELMRSLDKVGGIKGVSFALSEEQYKALKANYTKAIKDEEEAIKELNKELVEKNIPANGYTRHLAEKDKAKAENRNPRLTPFDVIIDLTWDDGLNSRRSYTCKNKAVDILKNNGVIDESTAEEINASKFKHAFPCSYSLNLQPIHLISTGELQREESKGGNVFFNPVWGKNKLYWGTPIITVDKLDTLNTYIETQYSDVKRLLNRVKETEEQLYKTIERAQDTQHIAQLKIQLQRVQNLAHSFIYTDYYQKPEVFTDKISKAEIVLNVATLAMEPERVNSSFLLRASESIAAQNALIGLLTLALALAAITIVPLVGITLGALGAIPTGLQLYRFYKEERDFAEAKVEYESSQSMAV